MMKRFHARNIKAVPQVFLPAPPSTDINWILESGSWDDSEDWNDNEIWKDGP